MVAIEFFSIAAGLAFFVLLVAVSIAGPRDRGSRLSGNEGALVPYGDESGGEGGK